MKLIYPEPLKITAEETESFENWGFADTKFAINKRGNVTIEGNRYELSGQELPRLLPWISNVLGIEIDPTEVHQSAYPVKIPSRRESDEFTSAIEGFLNENQINTDGENRLRHGHGQTQEEVFALKHFGIKRIPDLVVYPENEQQVAELIKTAKKHDVSLIPFGGGTNVTDALRCHDSENRLIVSVDMRRMNRILWIDTENMMACIEAGAVGRHIMQTLEKHNFTMGHEPDSVEFSTLGGWIATNASGMKKNKYGNIEDIVLDITVATADGKLER
ncbi:MAG TPA: FAD-dependent oxidoreductase, partial [Pyrinomonadaceae bacterium]|nr:FAD-dependent oxidoreductase [Pyrinomonadaceae bacterium]